MAQTMVEQRKETRTQLSWPVSVWVPNASQFYNGLSANISKSGVFLRVPDTTPLKPGSIIEINFPRTAALARQKGQYARIKRGKVVRVEPHVTGDESAMGVGIAFDEQPISA